MNDYKHCRNCGSFATHPTYIGKCFLTKKVTSPDWGPMIIGPNAYFQSKRDGAEYTGPIWDCFTPISSPLQNHQRRSSTADESRIQDFG